MACARSRRMTPTRIYTSSQSGAEQASRSGGWGEHPGADRAPDRVRYLLPGRLRNRSPARAARIRDLLSGERITVSAKEAPLGSRLRQYPVGLVCWAGDAAAAVDNI